MIQSEGNIHSPKFNQHTDEAYNLAKDILFKRLNETQLSFRGDQMSLFFGVADDEVRRSGGCMSSWNLWINIWS